MSGFRHTTGLRPDQTIASFLSNLAASNGAANMYSFCKHMALAKAAAAYSSRSIQSCEFLNTAALCSIGGVRHDAFALGSVERIDKHWAAVGGQKVRHKDIAYQQFRHCPACLSEDFEKGKGTAELRTYARLWWLVNTIETCPVHNVRLVCSSRNHDKFLDGDFAQYVRSNRDEIADLYERRQISPSFTC